MVEQFGRVHKAILSAPGGMIRIYATAECLRPASSPYNSSVDNSSPSSHPRRIACLQPSATVILDSLGELDCVVACTKYCADVVPGLRHSLHERVIIADSWTSKSAEILACNPDLVIAAVPYQEASVIEILKAGVRFLGLAPRTLNDIYADIALIAGIVGASDRGAKVISDMREAIADMKSRTAALPRRRVFCEEWGKPIIASQPWVAELVQAAGGEILATPGAQCSAERIAQMDPEVIIAAWCGAGDRVPLAKIVSQRGWSNTTAARTSQVYCISDELLNTPAPTLVAGLRALSGAIHPEIFGPQRGLCSVKQTRKRVSPVKKGSGQLI
jgi:iron complex transport system substrate-binding protein